MVGPTATGKSALAVDVALATGGEIVSADAFQIYQGLDLLTAKPEAHLTEQVPHHLLGTTSAREEMNAAIFRGQAKEAIAVIQKRKKRALLVGGSGLYIKALTHGLSVLPPVDVELRRQLNELSTEELGTRLAELDAVTADNIDLKNRRRVARALEICLQTGRPAAPQRKTWPGQSDGEADSSLKGVFVFRDKDDLYERINQRVERMFAEGVVEEVRNLGEISLRAGKALGLTQIRLHLEGRLTRAECVAALQQSTRRYAKRQLTWFRHQTNFEPLNLSLLSHVEAVAWIAGRITLPVSVKE